MKVIKKIICALLIASTLSGGINVSFAAETAEPDVEFPSRLISLEAEDGIFSNSESIVVAVDANASGGKAAQCTLTNTPSARDYNITFNFDMKRSGYAYIWVRIRHGYRGAACYISVNNSKFSFANNSSAPLESGKYWWVRTNSRYAVNEGENTLVYSFGHPVYLDKVIITTSNEYVPSGVNVPDSEDYGFDYNDSLGSKAYISYVEQSHPRLLIDPADITRIRDNLTHPQHKTFYSQFRSAVASPNNGLGADVNNSDNWKVHQNLEYNALNYLLFRDINPESAKSSAQNAINGTINMLDRLKYSEDSHNVLTPLFVAAEVYDWCYDEMSDSQKEKIIRLGIMHMENSFLRWPYIGDEHNIFNSGYGAEQGVMRDFFSFAIAVYDEFPEAYYILSKHIFENYIPALNYFYEGQSVNQNGSYYGILLRMRYELFLKWILNRLGCGELISPWQENVAMQYAYGRRPDGLFMNDGDDGAGDVGYYLDSPHTAFLAGNLYRNPMLRQEMFRSELNMNIFAPHYLILNDPTIGLSGYESLPLSNWGGNLRGIMHARTSWDEGRVSSNAMLVNMKMPEKFFKGHEHLDAGGFEIYYKGNLAIDSGVYGAGYGSVFASAHDYGYNKQTLAHNCMLIYNEEEDTTFYTNYSSMGGQVPDKSLWSGISSFDELKGEKTDYAKILGYDYGDDMNKPEYTYLKGDLTKPYAGKADKYTRTFIFSNFFDDEVPGALVVLDKVVTSKPGTKKTWLLHTHSTSKPVVLSGSKTIRFIKSDNGYKARLYTDILLPAETDINVIGGTGNEFLVGDKNYAVSPGNGESGKHRVEISPKEESGTDYFLNVLQPTGYSGIPERYTPTLIDTETHFGVRIKDRIMYLSKNEERYSERLSFSIEGEQEVYSVQIDALKEGTWNIKGEGFDINKQVTDNGGIINFSAPPGEYVLTYLNGEFREKDYNMFSALDENAKDDRVLVKMKNSVGTGGKFEFCELNAIKKDGVVYVDADTYAKYTGSKVISNDDGSFRLQKNFTVTASNPDGLCYSEYRLGENSYIQKSIFNTVRKYMIKPPYEEEGKKYIPILTTAAATSSSILFTPEFNTMRITPASNVVNADSGVNVDPSLDMEYPCFADEESFYLFGKLNTAEKNPVEYGIAVSVDEGFENPTFYPFKEKYSKGKQFGIQLKYEATDHPVIYTAYYKKFNGEYAFTGKRALRKKGEAGMDKPVAIAPVYLSKFGQRNAVYGSDWIYKADVSSATSLNNIFSSGTNSKYQGTSQRIALQFEIPEIPKGYVIYSAKLKFKAYTSIEDVNAEACLINDDWYTMDVINTVGYWPVYNNDISLTRPVVKAGNGFGEEIEMELRPEVLTAGNELNIAIRQSWVTGSVKNNKMTINTNDKNNLPYLEIQIAKTED